MNNPRQSVPFVRPSMGFKPAKPRIKWWQALLLSLSIIGVYYVFLLVALYWYEAISRHVH